MERFEGRIEAGLWTLVPRVGGWMQPCDDGSGRWIGTITVAGAVARAMTRGPGRASFLLRTSSGPVFTVAFSRWWPVGDNATVEFIADVERADRSAVPELSSATIVS